MATHIHHEQKVPDILICAVITISDTRTEEDDHGGNFIADALKTAGHDVDVTLEDESQLWQVDDQHVLIEIRHYSKKLLAPESWFFFVIRRKLPSHT